MERAERLKGAFVALTDILEESYYERSCVEHTLQLAIALKALVKVEEISVQMGLLEEEIKHLQDQKRQAKWDYFALTGVEL